MTYPDGSIPCGCCGTPIGKDSPAAKRGKRCWDCERLTFVQFANPHDTAVCAQDRSTVIAFWVAVCKGENKAESISLPSGRTLLHEAATT